MSFSYLYYTAERRHPEPQFKWRSRYWSFLLKLDPGRPSPTIQAQPGPNVGPFHWENRRLRVGEIKRLFTFPDEFDLVGSRASIQAQLGNAVAAAASGAGAGVRLQLCWPSFRVRRNSASAGPARSCAKRQPSR
jgi:site-specific DNA-cytosine methylase